jgi:AcrR family transcriptional regulator
METKSVKNAQRYGAEEWLQLGSVATPSTREKMIMIAIEEIITSGPADFNALKVCERLGVKTPMVNYYFKNRDGLLSEAVWWAYRNWSISLRKSMREAPRSPEKRLRAFIHHEIEWALRFGGMALLMHYPLASAESHRMVEGLYGEKMQEIFDYHLALLAMTIHDLRTGELSSLDFDEITVPKAKLMLLPHLILSAGHIAWMTHGISSWATESHVATKGYAARAVKGMSVSLAKKTYIDLIVKVAAG